jgi:hypothetical protein
MENVINFSEPVPRNKISSNSSQQEFLYQALDRSKASIRLVRIHPELSPDGRIQCDIQHATIGSSYFCLSYVWGDTDDGEWIYLNGKHRWVRDNLWLFLSFARHKQHIPWLWIDALCIDQTDVQERNHQVQQMGLIYARADEVISWFGARSDIAMYLAASAGVGEDSTGLHALCNSDYWDRAWITQEVTLARRITLMARDQELPMDLLPWSALGIRNQVPTIEDRIKGAQSATYLKKIEYLSPQSKVDIKGSNLLYLLYRFRNKNCSFVQDRIFSLLALCGDASDLKVDYEISPEYLAQQVLSHCGESFCLCAIHTIGDALGLDISMRRSESQRAVAKCIFRLDDATQIRGCEGTSQRPSLVYQQTNRWIFKPKTTTIIIGLEQLCGRYKGSIRFTLRRGYPGYSYRHTISTSHESHEGERRYRYDGFEIRFPVDRSTCTLYFSLGLLLDVARMAQLNFEEPCQVVTGVSGVNCPVAARYNLQLCDARHQPFPLQLRIRHV